MTTKEYNECVDLHSDGVFRFIVKQLRDSEKAKDVVQETFTKLWVKCADISHEKSKSYLFSTAYHTMIDMIRKDKRSTMMEDEHLVQLQYNRQYSDLKEVLDVALNRLPEIQKSVLLLRDYEGYSYQEIAEITNLNEGQVKVYIFRARKNIKEYIGAIEKVI